MAEELASGLAVRQLAEGDHGRVLAVMDQWWGMFGGPEGSVQRALLLPRLFFQHFTDSSWVVEDSNAALRAFLVGFLSRTRPEVAYIHFAGVDPALCRGGVGAALYRRFFLHAAARGASVTMCITSPGNTGSLAFHTSLGFSAQRGDASVDGVPVHRHYDGPGLDRVVLIRSLERTSLTGSSW